VNCFPLLIVYLVAMAMRFKAFHSSGGQRSRARSLSVIVPSFGE
jgi:hypothetical protein